MVSFMSITKQGPQKFTYTGIFTPAAIRNGFLVKFKWGKTVKNVQIDPQITDIWLKKLNVCE